MRILKSLGVVILILLHHSFFSQSINPACTNIDFESLPIGPLQSSSGWNISETYNNSILCNTGLVFTQTPTVNAFIVNTPLYDNICGNVLPSPLGGSSIARVGYTVQGSYSTKISQTFSVTSANCFYRYASLNVVTAPQGHDCCHKANMIYNFLDCSNNLIASKSNTFTPPVMSTTCQVYYPATWNTFNYYEEFTNWEVITEDLSNYVGSCITVEVIASGCALGGHSGYCYYDAQCLSSLITVNTNPTAVNIYTTCATTATLNALSGFNSYSWSGPSGSGINNDPNASVTATISGIYTLTAISGTNSSVQTITLTLNNPQSNVQISNSSFSICQGNPIALQTTGSNLTSYLWSTGSTSNSISVTPSITTVYSVTATNSLGCVSTDIKTVTVNPLPQVQISASSSTLCFGQSSTLSINNSCSSCTYLWNTSATSTSILVTPSVTTIYSIAVTSSLGCASSDNATITVNPVPQTQISSSNSVICSGQSTGLVVMNACGSCTYLWNTSATSASISVSPSVTSIYSVTTTHSLGCTSSDITTITVNPSPQVQITTSNSVICVGQNPLIYLTNTCSCTYLWSNGGTSSFVSVSPTLTTAYSLTVTGANGCSNTANQSIIVSLCTGEKLLSKDHAKIKVYPNPSSDEFTIEAFGKEEVSITNDEGKILYQLELLENDGFSKTFSGFTPGLYFVNTKYESIKIIIK